MLKTRTQRAAFSAVASLAQEAAAIVCGLILPRLILTHFGSAYNGITSSIAQFISCIAILKAGIGGVTRAALYPALASGDIVRISSILNATGRYLRRIALIFSGFVVVLACVYPFLVRQDFGWLFSASLVVILSLSTVAQYYFGYTHQLLLEADQKYFIISIVSTITIVLNTLVAALLIHLGCSLHVVKLGSAIVFMFPPLAYSLYVKHHYAIRKAVEADLSLIRQRWDAFAHQIANFVNDNTDVIVITVFLGVKEVSVYAVYNMIVLAIRKTVFAFSGSMSAAFGDMLAKKESELLHSRFKSYELLLFAISLVLALVVMVMALPFVSVYTKGVSDVDYLRPWFAAAISVCLFVSCMKLPYQQLVYAAGMFKQTRRDTILEAIINIGVSLSLVKLAGIEGVIAGTICAAVYRSSRFSSFVSKNIVTGGRNGYWLKVTCGLCLLVATFFGVLRLPQYHPRSFAIWAATAAVVFLVVSACICALSFLAFRTDFLNLLKVARGLLQRFFPQSRHRGHP